MDTIKPINELIRQIEKARMWFNRAISIDPDFGDSWSAAYRFEVQNGTPEKQQDIINRCIEATSSR